MGKYGQIMIRKRGGETDLLYLLNEMQKQIAALEKRVKVLEAIENE